MHVDLYERIWMWTAAAIIVLFLGAMVATSAVQAVQPPSHVETVDPTALATHPDQETMKMMPAARAIGDS